MLRVLLHELLRALPQSRNCRLILVQTQDEAVLLVVVGHELEGVVVDVAVELDARLHTPVPLVLLHERVLEEEPGFISTHVTIADGISIDDLGLGHVFSRLPRTVLVDPFGERPVLLGNLAVSGVARGQSSGDLLKVRIERFVVQEDPVVIEFTVESILDLTDRLGNVPQVAVSRQGDKGRVHPRPVGRRGREADGRLGGRRRGGR